VERFFEPEFGRFSAVRCPIFFVPGNHEDYDYIASTSRKEPLNGENNTSLRVAGIWGIENARPNAPYQIKASTAQQLRARGRHTFDLLLTHDAPAEAYPHGGSALITQVIRECCPDIHLFGHVHPSQGIHEFLVPGCKTKSLVLKHVSFGKDGSKGLRGAMGILDWDGSRSNMEIVNEDWLQQMNYKNWDRVLPECISPTVG
jgi:hypothetical protein